MSTPPLPTPQPMPPADEPRSNVYAIYRQSKRTSSDKEAWFWTVRVVRQGKPIIRAFPFMAYGGEEIALIHAQAYRDVLMRVLPPATQQQRNSHPQARNRSGIPGVRSFVRQGTTYWQATHTTRERQRSKSFSTTRHGEGEAKRMAIATRERWLQEHNDYFLTHNVLASSVAEQEFAHLLERAAPPVIEPLETISPDTMHGLVGEIDAWFDRLRPRYAAVHASFERPNAKEVFVVRVSDTRTRGQCKRKQLYRGPRRREALIEPGWLFVSEFIEALYGAEYTQVFAERYRAAFFAIDPDTRFHVRDCVIRPDQDAIAAVPESLRPWLPDFVFPAAPAPANSTPPLRQK